MSALAVIGEKREVWRGIRIVVHEDGRLSVTDEDSNTGTRQVTHYKLRIAGSPLVWNVPRLLQIERCGMEDFVQLELTRSQTLLE
jgi:hypothetical protein